jgi:hypothetical protein
MLYAIYPLTSPPSPFGPDFLLAEGQNINDDFDGPQLVI